MSSTAALILTAAGTVAAMGLLAMFQWAARQIDEAHMREWRNNR